MKRKSAKIFSFVTLGIIVTFSLYLFLPSNNLWLYWKTGIFLPKSATNVLYQTNTGFFGDGDQSLSFNILQEDVGKILSGSFGRGFSEWRQGPVGKSERIPSSGWIKNIRTVENSPDIFSAIKCLLPGCPEHILVIVDLESQTVIVFQHNA